MTLLTVARFAQSGVLGVYETRVRELSPAAPCKNIMVSKRKVSKRTNYLPVNLRNTPRSHLCGTGLRKGTDHESPLDASRNETVERKTTMHFAGRHKALDTSGVFGPLGARGQTKAPIPRETRVCH